MNIQEIEATQQHVLNNARKKANAIDVDELTSINIHVPRIPSPGVAILDNSVYVTFALRNKYKDYPEMVELTNSEQSYLTIYSDYAETVRKETYVIDSYYPHYDMFFTKRVHALEWNLESNEMYESFKHVDQSMEYYDDDIKSTGRLIEPLVEPLIEAYFFKNL